MLDLTDDLTPNQFQALLQWLWIGGYRVSRANLRAWRLRNNLPA